MAKEDLLPVRTKEEAKQRGHNGGVKSGEARRAKKTIRDVAKYLMNSEVSKDMPNVKETLRRMGVPETDQTYQAAVAVRLMQKAMLDGDTSAIRLLGELTGDLGPDGYAVDQNIVDMQYPAICIPDNGRDDKKEYALKPQAGPQTMFMASSADIVIYGGAAGGGKTFALLLEALRHKDVPRFGCTIFRQNYNQITSEGGLWDASHKIFDNIPGAEARSTPRFHWEFSGGGRLSFAHLDRDDNLKSWQGSEIAYIGFDELTHFTKHQFLYMLSRNRTTCGVKPYVRATCNPDADSWVADFISWWINPDTGYAMPERSGRIRYMCVLNDNIYWADTPEELAKEHDISVSDCKSVTFIASRLEDNKILMESDPSYLASLKALTEIDKERLLYGNWKIKPAAGLYFRREQANIVKQIPGNVVQWVRGWDLAATSEDENGDAAYTAGVLIGKTDDGRYVIADVINKQLKANDVRKLIKMTAETDRAKYDRVVQRLPQDPGQAGKEQAETYIKMLSGFVVKAVVESGSKASRAEPLAAQWQAGNVDVLIGEWNEMYFNQLESFPESKFKDMVDASSSAFNEIETGRKPFVRNKIKGGI